MLKMRITQDTPLIHLRMNQLSIDKRTQIFQTLVEGNSLRSTARLCKCSINTVMKFLIDMGGICMDLHDSLVRGLECKRIQADEIWSFILKKQSNKTHEERFDKTGTIWTWIAIDPDTKLVVSWLCTDRSDDAAYDFMSDLKMRLKNRIQLTTDGYTAYVSAVKMAFGDNVDFARYIKKFGNSEYDDENPLTQKKYSSMRKPKSIEIKIVSGDPDPYHIDTAYVERQNLTLRMHSRRFTRLTNAFSKKYANHVHAQAIHFMYYNFCKVHGSLKTTPAVASGIADEVWPIEKIVDVLVKYEESRRMDIYEW